MSGEALNVAVDARAIITGGWSLRRYTAELMRGLLGLDVGVTAWIAGWNLQALGEELRGQLERLELAVPVAAVKAPGKLLYAERGPALWRQWSRLQLPRLLPKSADLYHAIHWPFPLGRRPRAILTIHDLIALRHPEWAPPGAESLCRAIADLAPRAAQVIVDSDATRQDLLDCSAVDPGRVTTVPLGVRAADFARPISPQELEAVRQRHSVHRPYFLAVSTIEPRKNITAVIRAYDLLCERGHGDWDLRIIGVPVGPNEEFEELVARPRSGRVHVIDQVSEADLTVLMQAAGGFVFASLAEGFGLPVLEAFAAGCPVISANTTSLPEVAGDAALMVDPHEPEQIAAAMERLMNDPVLADDLRRRGRERITQFTWERTAQLTLEVYRRALQP